MVKRSILITGGAGFIGSHVVRLFVNEYPEYNIVNFDCLTYAGNLENNKDVENKDNYFFVKGDITSEYDVKKVFDEYNISDVIHLAAESHVDRSITDPNSFVNTNVIGTVNLLNECVKRWYGDYEHHRFHHVSTDEVYGALDMNKEHKFTEETPYSPHSPYSASKASSDQFVKAYHDTYGLNVTISNCSNNYGPNQFPEKLIPLTINKLLKGEKVPVYGTGENVRDWLYVEDHARAINLIFHGGRNGETYNIGGASEKSNLEIVKRIISILNPVGRVNYDDYIEFVEDRKGHDLRYAIDFSKIKKELSWKPSLGFNEGMYKTVLWYVKNTDWIKNIETGKYKDYYREHLGILNKV